MQYVFHTIDTFKARTVPHLAACVVWRGRVQDFPPDKDREVRIAGNSDCVDLAEKMVAEIIDNGDNKGIQQVIQRVLGQVGCPCHARACTFVLAHVDVCVCAPPQCQPRGWACMPGLEEACTQRWMRVPSWLWRQWPWGLWRTSVGIVHVLPHTHAQALCMCFRVHVSAPACGREGRGGGQSCQVHACARGFVLAHVGVAWVPGSLGVSACALTCAACDMLVRAWLHPPVPTCGQGCSSGVAWLLHRQVVVQREGAAFGALRGWGKQAGRPVPACR